MVYDMLKILVNQHSFNITAKYLCIVSQALWHLLIISELRSEGHESDQSELLSMTPTSKQTYYLYIDLELNNTKH